MRWRDPRLEDALLALALLVVDVLAGGQQGELAPAHLALLPFIFGPLALRRRSPLVITWVIGGALLANLGLGYPNSYYDDIAAAVAFYTVVVYARDRRLKIGVISMIVGVHAGIALSWHQKGHIELGDLPYNWVAFALPVVLGYGVRTRRAFTEELQRGHQLQVREAALEERTRIARELHDVIAHSVSVMVLQATAGARVAQRDPAAAASTFEVIQQSGREALLELRRAVGVLRSDAAADLEPQPGLDRIGALLATVRAAGLPVDLRIKGRRRPVPAGVELSAYRRRR